MGLFFASLNGSAIGVCEARMGPLPWAFTSDVAFGGVPLCPTFGQVLFQWFSFVERDGGRIFYKSINLQTIATPWLVVI